MPLPVLKVIKIGGNVVDNPELLHQFLLDFTKIPDHKILVHGGGKIATQLADKMGIETKMVEGRRITDADTIDLVTMVYGGLINKQIVAKLQALSYNAIGLTGADAGCFHAMKRPVTDIDYGFVGDVLGVDAKAIEKILQAGFGPVFAPLTASNGQILNTNADTMAQSLATGLAQLFETELIYCFEKPGVLLDADDDSTLIENLNPLYYEQLKSEGRIFKGMIPKLDNAFKALQANVKKVIIGHAKNLGSINSSQPMATTITL